MKKLVKKASSLSSILAGAAFLVPAIGLSSALTVDVSIRPGGEPNSIYLFSKGVIAVAILGTETFDVSGVDGTSLAFGPGEAALAHAQGPHWEDVNDDGFTDLVMHFGTQQAGIAAGDTEACVTGELFDGTPFAGCDAIRTLPRSLCSAPNLVANAGFEDSITADGPPFVGLWQAFSEDDDEQTGPDVARTSTRVPRTGLKSLELGIDDKADSFAGVFQDVVVAAGQAINYSGWHLVEAGPASIEIRIEWRDSNTNVEVDRTGDLAPTPGSDYEAFSLREVVPAGADIARIVYAIESIEAGTAPTQAVYVDDVCVAIE